VRQTLRSKTAPKEVVGHIFELIPIHVEEIITRCSEERPLSFLVPDILHRSLTPIVQVKGQYAFEKDLKQLIDIRVDDIIGSAAEEEASIWMVQLEKLRGKEKD
jgi:hypothetical protein